MAEDLARTDTTSEIAAHAAAYHKFTLLVKCVMVLAASMISFLALWFAADVGFIAALIVGLVVLALGTFALRHGWGHSSEEGSIAYPQSR